MDKANFPFWEYVYIYTYMIIDMHTQQIVLEKDIHIKEKSTSAHTRV